MSDAGLVRCTWMRRVVALLVTAIALPAQAQWPQWGGPDRNFTIETSALADRWPEDGPQTLWNRDLGDGHATVVVEDGMAFTMYRLGTNEFSVALDARTGKTVWEHKNASPVGEGTDQYGFGPNSTPLISEGRLYTVGSNLVLHCFDKTTGEVLWETDLVEQFDALVPHWGYSCSPIAYKDAIIVPVDRESGKPRAGRAGRAATGEVTTAGSLMAFDKVTGRTLWASADFRINYSSPIVVSLDGEEHLVLLMNRGIMGVNPRNGELIWYEAFAEAEVNIGSPLWVEDDLLFYSNPHHGRLLKLDRREGKISVAERWKSRGLRIYHASPIRIGDCLLGSSGADPALLSCVDIETGERAWVERGFGKATCLYGDGKLFVLDENGWLALAQVTSDGLTVRSKCKVSERYSWAAPTLVGRTLYVRDRKHIMAFDLG